MASIPFFGAHHSERVKIAIFCLSGEISQSNPEIQRVQDYLLSDVHDHVPDAIILSLNSHGGSLAVAQEVSMELEYVEKEMGVRTVAIIREVATSAAFYLATCTQTVYAQPGSVLGGVGAVIHAKNFSALHSTIGLECTTIKSVPQKDALSPFRSPDPEQIVLLEHLALDIHDQFLQKIITKRVDAKGAITGFSDGRLLSGRQAADLGLVDCIGGIGDAIRSIAHELDRKATNVDLIRICDTNSHTSSMLSGLLERFGIGHLVDSDYYR